MTSLRERDGDQPLPTKGRENVQDALIEMIKERRALGVQRYGRPLQTFNGRDAVTDALEEALDLSTYLMQVKLEMAALKAERDYLARTLSDAIDIPVIVLLDNAAQRARQQQAQVKESADWAVQATYPVEEVAVHPQDLDSLKERLKLTEPEKLLGAPIGEYFGFPIVTDNRVPRNHIYMRPRQRQV